MSFSTRSCRIREGHYLTGNEFFYQFRLKIYLYGISALIFVFSGIPVKAQVLPGDSLALVTLYQSTDGDHWVDHSNWLTGSVSTWYGITIMNDRVMGISLSNNNLNGTLPEGLDALSNLEFFQLAGNNLTGSLPSSIGNMDALITLDLSTNSLSGPVPGEIGGMDKLQNLILVNCFFSGSIPEEIGQIQTLRRLDLFGNQFSGAIPNSIYSLSFLNVLRISGQGITGSISPLIENLISLQRLTFHDTQLTGELPSGIWNLSTLEDLRLTRNNLYGSILPDISNLINLITLHLEENHFSGNIPAQIGNLTKLRILDLSRNDLNGPVPSSLANLSELTWFISGDNFLNDLPDLSSMAKITFLDCRNNKLDFGDLESNLSIPNFVYFPQKPLGDPDTIGVNSGEEFILTLEIGGNNNLYQWYKDSVLVPGADSPVLNIAQFSQDDEGDYMLQINSSLITDLTLTHATIRLVTIKEQSLILPELNEKTYGDEPFNLEAIASSGLPVQYSLVSGHVAVSGETVTILGPGEVTIEVVQKGNEEYLPVNDFIVFTVSKASQMLIFEAIDDQQANVGQIVLHAETDSGLEPVFVLKEGDASLTGNELDVHGAGQITVEAFQPGNDNYLPSDTITHQFMVNKVLGIVSINDTVHVYDGQEKTVTVSTSPEGLSTTTLYNDPDQSPRNAGLYEVTVNIEDKIYYGSAETQLIIEKAPAEVMISDLNHTEDGSEKEVTISTDPVNLNVSVFYSGNPEPPITAGEYEVIAVVDELNYQGGDTATLCIEKITGLEWVGEDESCLIYPNPIKWGRFYIENKQEVFAAQAISIYDPDGKLVFRKENLSTGLNEIELILPKSGIYFLVIHSSKKDISKKLIFQ